MSPRPLWRFPRGDRDARPPRPAAAWSVTPRPLREWSSLTSTPSVRQPGERRPERGITVRSQCGEWGLFIIVNIVANEFPNMKTKTSLRERHAPCWLFALVTSCAMTGTDPSLPRTWRLGFNYRADRSQSQTGDQWPGIRLLWLVSLRGWPVSLLCHIGHWYLERYEWSKYSHHWHDTSNLLEM